MGQLYDLKREYEETVESLAKAVRKQEKKVKWFENINQFDEEYDEQYKQLCLLRSMYYDKKYELEWITLGHAPDDYAGIYSLRTGENDFADRESKKDSRMAKRARNNIQDYR